MTADRRLRIGGWAALLVAVLAALQVIALFLSSHEPDPFSAPAVRIIAAARAGCLLVAVLGLDQLFRSIASGSSPLVRSAGVTGSILAIGTAVTSSSTTPGTMLAVASTLLIGLWFIGGGAILMSAGRQLARVGWPAELGGLGSIAVAVAILIPFGGPVGTGQSWIDWFYLLGLFVVVYLVRIWSYVVRGRLPGPGIL